MTAAVYLKSNRKKRAESGHPWVFESEVERVEGTPEPGQLIALHDHKARFIATGYYNAKSKIIVRIVSYSLISDMDEPFFVARLEQYRG